MNYSKIRKVGSRWEVIGGNPELGSVVWARFRSRIKAEEYAVKMSLAAKGEYLGEVAA